ncbi:hypothetical protein [Aphanothece hegewaldii]|uniref:hypothetical protein n=1 Tax=Aphanothece hegewaldii TaxID=1521625 RepID=UPI001C62D0D1|nr:hypothetical protein [Aphanothece hegewaldii]
MSVSTLSERTIAPSTPEHLSSSVLTVMILVNEKPTPPLVQNTETSVTELAANV